MDFSVRQSGIRLVGRLRLAKPRWRTSLVATALSLACLGGGTSAAFADQTTLHQVRDGDTIFSLANHWGITPEALASANQLGDPNALAVGQVLWITVPAAAPSSLGHLVVDKHDEGPGPDASESIDPTLAAPPMIGQTVATSYPDGILKILARTTPENAPPSPAAPAVAPAAPLAAPAPPAAPQAPPAPPAPTILWAPYHSQFDGSIWGRGNCGPTALAMALGAVRISANQLSLRHYADQQMGIASPDTGTTWESLAYAARIAGASPDMLFLGKGYRSWTIDDLKGAIRQGHPVMLLVRFWNLPDHGDSGYSGDHYIVALGFDSNGNLIYNDPAFASIDGSNRTINRAHLLKAWSNTSVGLVRTAMALAT